MTKTKKMFNLFSISEARNVIFGIATLWIGLFHSTNLTMEQYTSNEFIIKAFQFFKGTGNVGVDMFLFLSGIGLFFSFSKDSRVLSFWKKRFARVVPPAFLIAVIYFSVRYVTGRLKSGLVYYLCRLTFVYFFIKGERVFWFISLILLLYLLFQVFYKVIERFRGVGTIILVVLAVGLNLGLRTFVPDVFVNVEVAFCRIPVFIIGIWCGRFVMEKKAISRHWLWAFLAVAVGMLVFLYNYPAIISSFVSGYNPQTDESMYLFLYRYAACPLGICLVVLDSYVCMGLRRRGRCHLLRSFLEFIGAYSMEFYMIYLNINNYLNRVLVISQKHQIMLYVGDFFIALVLCIAVRAVCDKFMAAMQKKPKQLSKHAEG